MNYRLLIVVCLIVVGVAVAGRAETPQEKFNKIFADKVRQAARTPGSADDAKLADEFLDVAEMLEGEAEVKTLLYQKAALFAAKDPSGYETAMKAVGLLDEAAPDRKSEWDILRLGVLKSIYLKTRGAERADAGAAYLEQLLISGQANIDAGRIAKGALMYRQGLAVARVCQRDRVREISARIRAASGLMLVVRRRDSYKARLDKNPSDDATRTKLIMLELLEFDNPSAAAKLCNEDVDEMLRTYLPLAAGAIDKTADTTCRELGQWYEKLLVKAASKTAKANAAKRARAWYSQFLVVHETNDMTRSRVALAIRRLDERAAKSAVKPSNPASSTRLRGKNLLKLINTEKNTIVGQWKFGKAGLVCHGSGRQVIAIPLTTTGGYDINATFTILKGTEMALLIPVGVSGNVVVMLGGWNGNWSGIGTINGAYTSKNAASIRSKDGQPPVPLNTRTNLCVSVRIKEEIAYLTVMLNGKKFTSWSGKPSALGVHSNWLFNAKIFGLGGNSSHIVWHSVQLQPVSVARR